MCLYRSSSQSSMMHLQLVHVSLYPISKQARLIENKWCIHMQPAQLVLACSEPPIYFLTSGQIPFLMIKLIHPHYQSEITHLSKYSYHFYGCHQNLVLPLLPLILYYINACIWKVKKLLFKPLFCNLQGGLIELFLTLFLTKFGALLCHPLYPALTLDCAAPIRSTDFVLAHVTTEHGRRQCTMCTKDKRS